jgi:DNA repair protein RecO (recombination protein O)
MRRSRQTAGIILASRRFGEYHKSLDILSPEEGIFRATAFGALKGKSRLSGVTEPFTEGQMYLYHDPVKERIKLTEVDPTDLHGPLREELSRFYIASFWMEFVIKSYAGGGEFAPLYRLLAGALKTLERTEMFEAITVHFVWRYLDLLGFRPSTVNCEGCGEEPAASEPLYLAEHSLLCSRCAGEGQPRLSPWARDFLSYSAVSPFSALEARLSGDSDSERGEREIAGLKRIMLRLAEQVVERPLNSLSQGMV